MALGALLAMGLGSAHTMAAQTFTVLDNLQRGSQGDRPYAGLVRDEAGNLYGTAQGGGSANAGTVFKVDSTGALTVLHSFEGSPDGKDPVGDLTRDGAGNLYGTTAEGGDSTACAPDGCGTIFEIDASGHESVLYRFSGGADGSHPYAGLMRDNAGDLYGTASFGGDTQACSLYGCGTLFRLDPSGNLTVLYTFEGGADGFWPLFGGVIGDSAGNLYGTTRSGGAYGFGTVFKLETTGQKLILHSFTGTTDGNQPAAGLIRDAVGNLYGTTQFGGTQFWGLVFKIDRTGAFTVMFNFGGTDGGTPKAPLVLDSESNLYGTTSAGGASACGTVFELGRNGTHRVLHSFSRTDGANPYAGLVRDDAGVLYGTTANGGAHREGVVFAVKP